ncbi:MAG: DNA repair exonuclease [Candidatus Heimdallarchaeota archaeon]|nr:DNA repair exonuclease [Candidatus Heimdallarchaeota archaeon]
MNTVHFVHTSDWHLGFMQYYLEERFDDFYQAAKSVIEKILELKPQFILHTGDLFHHQTPSPGAIRQAVSILSMVKEKNIPFYMIKGNHDAKSSRSLQKGGNVISLLDDLGLVTFIEDRKIEINEYVEIYGIGYQTGSLSKYSMENLLDQDPPSNDKFSILAMHVYIQGQFIPQVQLELDDFEGNNVNYIGVGHYHIPWKKPEVAIYVPGSSETTSTNDWRRNDCEQDIVLYSSFYEIKNLPNNEIDVKTHKIPVRPKIRLTLVSKAQSIAELEEEIHNSVRKKKEYIKQKGLYADKVILKLEVKTQLTIDELSLLDLQKLENELEILHLLHDISGKENYTQLEIETVINHHLKAFIQEIIGNDDDNKYMHLIDDLVRDYGNKKIREINEPELNDYITILDQNAKEE